MEKRLVLAISLMLVVAIVPSLLFRPAPEPVAEGTIDTTAAIADQTRGEPIVPEPDAEPVLSQDPAPSIGPASGSDAPGFSDSVVVESDLYRYVFTAAGEVVSAELKRYRAFNGDEEAGRHNLDLVRVGDAVLSQRLVVGADTLRLRQLAFATSADRVDVGPEGALLEFEAQQGSLGVMLRYRFRPDTYRFAVEGQVRGLSSAGAQLLVDLGSGIRSQEADTVDDYRNHALVTRARKAESLRFDRVSPLEVQAVPGPLQWAATKSKYFVAAILAVGPESAPLSGAVVQGGPRIDRIATHLDATVVLPLPQAGVFGFDVYLGPQEASRLRAIGNDFQNINPYGWVLRPVIMPIASVVVSILVWMHENLNLAYGWVLVLFGLGIRLILWPLNQRAMESQMRMQAAQPYMKEIQEKYKGDPQRLQQEMLKVYKEYNFNPLGGCLPMLIPMPVLFALFFVFANTIEFRGVPFLWLPDLSRADPLYIIPLVMGASMFALMKLGQRGVPPNPQTKVMAYFMPAFMTLILLRFASGLNLYYAAQNIFSLPQQWLISRKRLAASGSRSGG